MLLPASKIMVLRFCIDLSHVWGIVKGVVYCCANGPACGWPVGAGQSGSVFARARGFGANCAFFSYTDVIYE